MEEDSIEFKKSISALEDTVSILNSQNADHDTTTKDLNSHITTLTTDNTEKDVLIEELSK